MAGELVSRAIQPLIFIILARLLTPDDYGVMAAAIMVMSFTQIFWEAGLGKALIQRQGDVSEAANVAFWINLIIGIIISILLLLLATVIAEKLFQDGRVSDVIRIMTLQIMLGALGSVPTALLQKELKFNKLFWVRISTVALPGVFSIPLAWYGLSYWALVVGTLVGQLAQVIVLWRVSSWRPEWRFNAPLAKDLSRFGAWVGLTGLLAWFYVWIDSLFIGGYLGTHELGLYRTGNQFVTMIFGFLFAPVLPVLYSHLSSIQYDKEKLKDFFMRVIRIITFISIPLAFMIYAIGDDIGLVVFGSKWDGVGLVISVLALMHGFSWVVGANGEVYRALGKPSFETIVNISTLVIYLIGYYISVRKGFETFVWTRYALAMVAMFLHIGFGWLALRLPVLSIIKLILTATLIGLIAPALKILIDNGNFNSIQQIILVVGGSCTLMTIVIILIERDGFLKDLLSIIKKRSVA
jgi:O-antigen/teichoic acid export membrane protein